VVVYGGERQLFCVGVMVMKGKNFWLCWFMVVSMVVLILSLLYWCLWWLVLVFVVVLWWWLCFFVGFQILRRCCLFQELSCTLWFCGAVCFLSGDLPVLYCALQKRSKVRLHRFLVGLLVILEGFCNGLTQDLFLLLRGRLDFGFWR